MSRIVWLASYPKSGNTWFRAFLTNYLSSGDSPADINDLDTDSIASARSRFDSVMWGESSDMTPDEVERNRPEAYRFIASESPRTLYIKAHDAYVLTTGGEPLFPREVTQSAVYFVRNPLDVAISLAHHSGICIDDAIERMEDVNFALAGGGRRLHAQLRQRLLSWSEHVVSWLDQKEIAIHLMRFEDMLSDPWASFRRSLDFLRISIEDARLERAIHFSSFEALRKQEQSSGFREKPAKAKVFFRSGRAGEWKQTLTADQIARIIAAHSQVMHRLDYFNAAGEPR